MTARVRKYDADNTPLYQVEDGYGKVWFTGTLMACGAWIDPLLGIDFDRSMWGERGGKGIDDDRFTRNDDGTFTVTNYDGGGGIAGEFTIRPKESA